MNIMPITNDEHRQFEIEIVRFQGRDYTGEEMKKISIRNCLVQIPRIIKMLSYEMKAKQSDVSRCALFIGVTELWNWFGNSILEIDKCRQEVHKSGNSYLLSFFEKSSFDLGSNSFCKFSGSFPEEHINMCKGISNRAGINYGDINQVALSAGFLRAKELTIIDNEFCYDLIVRFGKWLRAKEGQAKVFADLAKSAPVNQSDGPRKTFSDIAEIFLQ